MKKLAIVGVSAALAAMPVLGVFAESTVVDRITVTVASSCELDITPNTAGGATENQWYGTGQPGDLVTPVAGTKNNPGSGTATSVVVKCNDADGYKISAAFTDLAGPGTAITYSASPEAAGGNGKWTAYANGTAIVAGATALSGDSTMTDSYAFTYKVGLGTDQAAGDYTGTATYTLSAN